MKIRGWPRAHDDESFTSWLWRCGLNASCREITEKDVADYCEYGYGTSPLNSRFFDPDFDFESVVTKSFCEKFGLPIKIVAYFFTPACHMVIDYVHRRNYCPKCIDDDLRLHRFPSWKKSWSYSFVACCKVHNLLLVPLSSEYFADSNKSWWAFTEISNGVHCRFSCTRGHGGIRNELLPTKITLAAQAWIELRLKEKARIIEFNFSSSAERLLRAYETLLTIFLRARNTKRCAGAAREVMNHGSDTINYVLYTYEECQAFGIPIAVPYHRMIALLMVA
ncbi:TniQ family protein, partial [Pseudomonas syringae pv. coryli]|uniref:TniQ family protein n=1 Tax=Pseudomonas syringae pv. coryli TaxID=317659 RepID=UPI000AC6EA01